MRPRLRDGKLQRLQFPQRTEARRRARGDQRARRPALPSRRARWQYFALCPVCNGANQQGRIQGFGKELSKCTVIVRAGNFGGDVNVTASRKTSSIKRMLDNHLTSGLHKFCAGLATAHRQLKRSRYTALTTSEELVARLFRTALQVIDEYGSFLSFEKWVRLQDLNGTDMGNRGHSKFTMREMIICRHPRRRATPAWAPPAGSVGSADPAPGI